MEMQWAWALEIPRVGRVRNRRPRLWQCEWLKSQPGYITLGVDKLNRFLVVFRTMDAAIRARSLLAAENILPATGKIIPCTIQEGHNER